MPVVCVPGWASSAFQFRKNLPALAEAGFRAIAVDLPGQGESEKPTDPTFYTIRALTNHLQAVLDELGIRRASLVGQSLGAVVVTALWRDAPARVAKLVLIAPVGWGDIGLVRVGRLLLPRKWPRLLGRLGWRFWWSIGLRHAYGERARPSARDVDEYWAPSRDPWYVASLVELVHRVDWRPIGREELESVTAPVLVVAGTRDPLLAHEEIAMRIKWLPNGEIVVIEGAGHPLQEEVPHDVNRALIRFLKA